jgi:RNA polymerase sigma-70 factor (sigma-E family)
MKSATSDCRGSRVPVATGVLGSSFISKGNPLRLPTRHCGVGADWRVVDAEDEFAIYLTAQWPALVRTAVLLGCHQHDAEDIVQTALIRCYASWSKVSRATNRDAYVYRVLVNAYNDSRRRRWWGERPTAELPENDDPTDAIAGVDRADAVDRALDSLSAAGRAVVVLRFYAGLSERETAEVLSVPVGTVKSRLARAVRQLAASEHLADSANGARDD